MVRRSRVSRVFDAECVGLTATRVASAGPFSTGGTRMQMKRLDSTSPHPRVIDLYQYLGDDAPKQRAVRWEDERAARYPRWKLVLLRWLVLIGCVAWVWWVVEVIV